MAELRATNRADAAVSDACHQTPGYSVHSIRTQLLKGESLNCPFGQGRLKGTTGCEIEALAALAK
jgi:hypothetical protein